MNTSRRPTRIASVLVALVALLASGVRAQESGDGPPVPLQELLSMVRAGMSDTSGLEEADRCLDFRLDFDSSVQLAEAGASDALLNALRDVCVAPPDLKSPGLAFLHGLVIPGSGQLANERGWRGGLVLVGSVAAISYGYLSATVTEACREPLVGGECLSGQLAEVETERPDLVAGLAVAGALALIGAIDGMMGAREVNANRLEAAGFDPDGGVSLSFLPIRPSPAGRAGDLRLFEVRFR